MRLIDPDKIDAQTLKRVLEACETAFTEEEWREAYALAHQVFTEEQWRDFSLDEPRVPFAQTIREMEQIHQEVMAMNNPH